MNTLDYTLLDVFSDKPLAGNPLAVFPHAGDLPADLMQRIAAELNLSETVFVTAADPAGGRYTVRIMTPASELPFAGHPTIGTAVALAMGAGAGEALSVELTEPIGPVSVAVEITGTDGGRARFTAPQTPARVDNPISRATAAALLELDPADVVTAPRSWSAGVPFLCVPVASAGALEAVRLDTAVWERLIAPAAAPHVYAYWLPEHDPGQVHARMFAPAMGITEDPATGAAAIAFSGELAARLGVADGRLDAAIHQGAAVGRPSRLELEARVAGGAVMQARLSGPAVVIGEGALRPQIRDAALAKSG